MTVLLVAEGDHREFDLLADAVGDRGAEAVLWDLRDWPSDVPVTYDVGSGSVTVDGPLDVEEVTGVFAWAHHLFDPRLTRFADEFEGKGTEHLFFKLDQWRGVFDSLLALFDHRGAAVYPAPDEQHYHETKPLQLADFEAAGVTAPATLFTTDADAVREFVATHGEVVYKPVAGNAAPGRLSADELDDAPLERLSTAPVQFQAFVPGDDVRAYFLDGGVVGASRYVVEEWSHKLGRPTAAERIDLRPAVRRDVERVAERAPLGFGAVDLRVSGADHAVLEVNHSPRFAFHDDRGATDVAAALADRLVA